MRSRLGRLSVLVLAAALLGAPALAASDPPQPDPTFGLPPNDNPEGAGVYAADISGTESADEARAVTPLADDSLVVAGIADNADDQRHVFLLKLRADGTPDPTVGTDGQVTWSVPGATSTEVRAMLVDTQGRVVIAGWRATSSTDRVLVVARFTADFMPDPTFGTDGYTVVPSLPGAQAWDLQEQPDGRLVVLGQGGTTPRLQVLRFTTAGGLDPTFGTGGIQAISGSRTTNDHAGLTITSDAKIVVVGGQGSGSSATTGLVARLTTAGALDPTFSGDGRLAVGGSELTDVVRLPSGKLVGVGATSRMYQGNLRAATRLVLVSSAGALSDWPGTSSAQRTVSSDDDFEDPLDLALQGDGKLLVTGFGGRSDIPDRAWLIRRTTPSGAFDPAWSISRSFSGNVPDSENSSAYSGAFTTDGKVVVAGRLGGVVTSAKGYSDTVVMRYRAAPVRPLATTELRETYSTGAWYSCGTTASNPCRKAVGQPVRFGGRIWPVPSPGPAQVSLQRTTGAPVSKVSTPTTREGNFVVTFDGLAPGSYRVHTVVPDSDTTTATKSVWRYVTVS